MKKFDKFAEIGGIEVFKKNQPMMKDNRLKKNQNKITKSTPNYF